MMEIGILDALTETNHKEILANSAAACSEERKLY